MALRELDISIVLHEEEAFAELNSLSSNEQECLTGLEKSILEHPAHDLGRVHGDADSIKVAVELMAC